MNEYVWIKPKQQKKKQQQKEYPISIHPGGPFQFMDNLFTPFIVRVFQYLFFFFQTDKFKSNILPIIYQWFSLIAHCPFEREKKKNSPEVSWKRVASNCHAFAYSFTIDVCVMLVLYTAYGERLMLTLLLFVLLLLSLLLLISFHLSIVSRSFFSSSFFYFLFSFTMSHEQHFRSYRIHASFHRSIQPFYTQFLYS